MKQYNKPALEPAQGNCLEQLIGNVLPNSWPTLDKHHQSIN